MVCTKSRASTRTLLPLCLRWNRAATRNCPPRCRKCPRCLSRCARASACQSFVNQISLAGFTPERILEPGRRECAVGFCFRARIVRDFLILQARRRVLRIVVAIGWRHRRLIFRFHGRPPQSYDLAPLKHLEGPSEAAKSRCLASKNQQADNLPHTGDSSVPAKLLGCHGE